jgi:hypothetical protein
MHSSPDALLSRSEKRLGHPAALVSTAIILLALYGWIFVIRPQQFAPRTDPAYYSWRIEALISEKPQTLLHITGPFHASSGGYRIAGAVLGGYLRRIAGVSQLETTVVLIVAQWLIGALLLAGFAYRQRRDPLIFHAVAAGSGSLLITPPFLGYADNVLCLVFLAAALWFVIPAAHDWRGRLGLGLFLLVGGFTHPTTLAVFCITLAIAALVRLLSTKSGLRRSLRLDGPGLATAGTALLIAFLSWTVGIWGVPESLSEAGSPPPKSTTAFIEKMIRWLKLMHPLWNGPLLALGIAGLLLFRKRIMHGDLARLVILWLLPLLGLLGFLVGLTYPYSRSFNTTLAWVFLVGIGTYLVIRFCIDTSRRRGIPRLTLIGVVAVATAIAANFAYPFSSANWNNPHGGWLPSAKKRDLDSLRSTLSRTRSGRPVIFVADLRSRVPWRIYGFAKNTSDLSRYGLPHGEIDLGYLYLGALTKLIANEPTITGDPEYDKLSRGYLAEADRAVSSAGVRPIIVLDKEFNVSGTNARFFEGDVERRPTRLADVWWVADGRVRPPHGVATAFDPPVSSAWHIGRVLAGLLLLLLPGLVGVRRLVPHPSLGEMLGMVPAISMAMLTLSGIFVLAIARAPFSGVIPWLSLAVAVGTPLLVPLPPRVRPSRSGQLDLPDRG